MIKLVRFNFFTMTAISRINKINAWSDYPLNFVSGNLTMPFFTREVMPGDAADINQLSNQLGYAITVPETLQNIIAIGESKNEVIFVAEQGRGVVGWIHVFHALRLESGSFCEIGGLVVNDKDQKMGIGKMLIEKARLWCREKGNSTLRVRCNIKRTDAHQFYLKLGFKENKQQKIFEINPA
jgi:GNAT superfamily N-acetyltransferase